MHIFLNFLHNLICILLILVYINNRKQKGNSPERMEKMEKIIKFGNVINTQISGYKNYKLDLGISDIAQLTMLGCKSEQGAIPAALKFRGDGAYHAWLVFDKKLIPEHYDLVERYEFECEFHHMDGTTSTASLNAWVKIFDDTTLQAEVVGKRIEVYRAGDFGCLIYVER